MNFKRLRGIYAVALITIAAALFAGCMNSMAGSVNGGETRGVSVLHFSATGIPDEYAEDFAAYNKRQNTRSILPDDPFDIDKSDPTNGTGQSQSLIFILEGKSETGKRYPAIEVKLSDRTVVDGKAVFDFVLASDSSPVIMDANSWSLTLTAYIRTAVAPFYNINEPVLVGYCSVDLRSGSGTAKFEMKIAGLTTPADVKIIGAVLDEDDLANASCTAGIYSKLDLSEVGASKDTLALNPTADDDFVEPGIVTDAIRPNLKYFVYNASGIKPGEYVYIMKFYDKNDNTKIIGSYQDTIVINPGNVLTKKDLVFDCLQKMPTMPSDLKATLVRNSQSSDGKTYQVNVTWTLSDYETNYELNLVEYDEDYDNGDTFDLDKISTAFASTNLDAPGAEKPKLGYSEIGGGQIYGMASMAPGSDIKDFPGSDFYGRGTGSSPMLYHDKSCILTLETGKLYEIQLRARNYIGVSGWTNRVSSITPPNGNEEQYGYGAPEDQHINRMYVSYDLNGGTLSIDGDTIQNRKGILTQYHSWTANANLIDGVNDGNVHLAVGTAPFATPFAAWLLEGDTAVNHDDDAGTDLIVKKVGDAVTMYTYKNAKVKASYGNKVNGSITQEEGLQDIKVDDITVYLNDTLLAKTGLNYVVSKYAADDSSNRIQIVLGNVGSVLTDTVLYKNPKVTAYVDIDKPQNIESTGSLNGGQFYVDLDDYASGQILTVIVSAETKNIKEASQTLKFTLK